MISQRKKIRNLFVAIVCASLFFLMVNDACSHVEPDMPDAIAEMEYQILLDIKPDDYQTRYLLGMVYFRQKKYDLAVEELQRVIETAPDYPYAYTGLGQVEMKHEEYDKAIELFRKAITILPEDNHVYYFLGQAFEAKGEKSEAEKAYQTAIVNHKKIPTTEKEKKNYEKDMARFQDALDALRSSKDRGN